MFDQSDGWFKPELNDPPPHHVPLFHPPPRSACWTQRWDTLLIWLKKYNSPLNRKHVIRACQVRLSDIPEMAVEMMLQEFFVKIEVAKTKFSTLFDREYPNYFDKYGDSEHEYLAEQILSTLQRAIGDLHASALDPFPHSVICLCGGYDTTRDICKRLFTYFTGIQTQDSKSLYSYVTYETKFIDAVEHLKFLITHPIIRHRRLFFNPLPKLQNHYNYLQASTMKQRTLVLELLWHADFIPSEVPKPQGPSLELQEIVTKLAQFAEERNDQYQTLYEYFFLNREYISGCIDLATEGQGQIIVDQLIDRLMELSLSSSLEAKFWKSQIRHFSPWPDLRPIYKSAISKVSNLEVSEHISLSVNSSSGNNKDIPAPNAQNMAEAAQKVAVSYSKIPALQEGRVRKILIKTRPIMNNLRDKTKGYFEYVLNEASQNITTSIAKNAVSVAKSWMRLFKKVKFEVGILTGLFSCKTRVTASALAEELGLVKAFPKDHHYVPIDTEIIAKNFHPLLSDLELLISDIDRQYSSFRIFLSNMNSALNNFAEIALD